MPKLYTKPSILLHFNDDILDNVNDIIPTGTTLIKSSNILCNVKNHSSVANKTFDISGKYIKIVDSSVYDTTNDFTLKFAEYITNYPSSGTACSLFATSTVSLGGYGGLLIGYGLSSGRAMYVSSTGTSWNQIGGYALPITLNQWVRWEFDYVSSTKTLYLFREGILLKSWVLTANPYYNSSYSSYINAWSTGTYGYVSGQIADFDFIKGTCSHTENFEPNPISSTTINKIFSPYLSDITYKYGRALYLDGSSYLSFPNFNLDTSKDFTVKISTYLQTLPIDSAILQFNCLNSTQTGAMILGHFSGGTTIGLYAASISNSWNQINGYSICTTASILNQWIDWELGYIDSTKTLYLFKNSILIKSWVLSARLYNGNDGINYLGRRAYNQTGYYDEMLILQGKCLHTSSFTTPTDEYVYIPYVINKIVNPYRLYGSVNKSTITLNVVNESVAVQYALYIGSNIISNLSYDNVRTINSNILVLGTNTLSIQIADGTIIGTLDIIVEEIYRKTSTRSFNDFDGGYYKKEVLVNTPIINEIITSEEDINKNNYVCVDKFVSQIQNN